MIKRLILTIAIGLLTVNASAMTFKLATLTPEGSQWLIDMRAAADEISDRTDGRVKFKYYGGGVMGNDKKVLRKIRIGQLHGGAFTANSLQQQYPDLNIYGLPLVFDTEAEVDHVRNALDERLRIGLEKAGYVSFGFAEGGFAYMMSNSPVTSLDDLLGQKVWVPEGDTISYSGMEALKLSPVTLSITDVLTGLQSGLVDIVATPPVAALVLQWHTKTKYITRMPIVYTMGYMAIDAKAFGKISAQDQAIVREVMTATYKEFNRINRDDNSSALAALESAGLKIIDAKPGELERWRGPVLEANRKLAEKGFYSIDLMHEVHALLDEFRAAQVASLDDTAATPEAAALTQTPVTE